MKHVSPNNRHALLSDVRRAPEYQGGDAESDPVNSSEKSTVFAGAVVAVPGKGARSAEFSQVVTSICVSDGGMCIGAGLP